MTEMAIPRITVASAAPTSPEPRSPVLIEVAELSLFYGHSQALKQISMQLREKVVTAFIGPSGCGKSTLLRCFNRMNDLIDNVRIEGLVKIANHNIYSPEV